MSKSSEFRALHAHPGKPLLLANIWDVGGARIVESLGAQAIATTSAGVAWSLGYADGNRLPVDALARLAASIVKVVSIPVSIDVEAGYADAPDAVSENLKQILDAGVAGINIEDGTDEPALLAKKIEAIKQTAASMDVELFINARTDVYLQDLVADDRKLDETLKRAATYRSAGADGLFVPALADSAQISQVTTGTELPVNLLAWPGLPKVDKLAQLGVRRLSAGSGIPQIAWQQVALLAETFLAEGDSDLFTRNYMAHSRLQQLFAPTQ
jgi:2-methylisocitrate lyase-like PEP mutase family enzyme